MGGRHAGGGRTLAACQHGWLEVGVTAGVLDQVVAPHEALVAQGAQEALLPRVSASVAGELVGAGKLLLAVGPGTWKRSLPCRMETFYNHCGHLSKSQKKQLQLTCSALWRFKLYFVGYNEK